MKKRILAVVAAAVMVISSTVMTFADTTTGLIGQYNFDGNLKNEVTGKESVMTAGKLTLEATGEEKMEYSNGVSDNAAYFNGVFTNYGVEILDGVPKTNTFTLSYDVFYTGYSQHTPTLNLATDWGSANAGTAVDQWASFGWGWQGNMSFAAGIWIHDQANKNPQEWVDFWQAGGNTELLDADGKWAGWANITYAVEAGVVTIYLNGEKIEAVPAGLDASAAVLNTVTEATRLFVGVNAWDTPVAAAIDNLYIYDRALTADDVKELISGRDYDAATAPEVEQPETTSVKGQLADKNNADYLQPGTVAASTEDGGSNMGPIIGIGAAVVVVIVIVVVVAVVAGKKKSNDDDDDEE